MADEATKFHMLISQMQNSGGWYYKGEKQKTKQTKNSWNGDILEIFCVIFLYDVNSNLN